MLGSQDKQVPDPFVGRNRRRKLTAVAVILLCSLTPVACASSSGTPASTKAATSGLTPIKMVIPANAPNFSPVFVAQAAGIFKKHGLSVTTAALSSGSSASAALLSGSVQFDTGVASDVLLANREGADLLAIASVNNAITLDLEVNKTWASTHNITTSQPLWQRLRGLKGAKIGTTAKGSITDLALEYMLSTVGLKTPTDYDEVTLGSEVSRLTALEHNEIQAAMFDPAGAALITQQGAGLLAAKGTDFPLLAKSAFTQVLTTASYAKSHPAIVREVAASIAEANNLIDSNPNRALPSLQAKFGSYKSVLAAVLPQYVFTKDARMSAASWTTLAQVLAAGGGLSGQGVANEKTDFTDSYLP
jgi:ABC-type nitrate/sulfonate/bicarbonate transport system substrate-binding protein